MGSREKKKSHGVPRPAEPRAVEDLPRVLSFALSAGERSAVLRVLRRYGPDRSASLRAALGLGEVPPCKGNARGR